MQTTTRATTASANSSSVTLALVPSGPSSSSSSSSAPASSAASPTSGVAAAEYGAQALPWMKDLPAPANHPVVIALVATALAQTDPDTTGAGAAGVVPPIGGAAALARVRQDKKAAEQDEFMMESSSSSKGGKGGNGRGSGETVLWTGSPTPARRSCSRVLCAYGPAPVLLTVLVVPMVTVLSICGSSSTASCSSFVIYLVAATVLGIAGPLLPLVLQLTVSSSALGGERPRAHVTRLYVLTTRRAMTLSVSPGEPFIPYFACLQRLPSCLRPSASPGWAQVVEHSLEALLDEWQTAQRGYDSGGTENRFVEDDCCGCCARSIPDDYDVPSPFHAPRRTVSAVLPHRCAGGVIPAVAHVRVERSRARVEFARVLRAQGEDGPMRFAPFGFGHLHRQDAEACANTLRQALRDAEAAGLG